MTGEEFRTARIALELRQLDIANRLGVAKDTVSRWERHLPVPLYASAYIEAITALAALRKATEELRLAMPAAAIETIPIDHREALDRETTKAAAILASSEPGNSGL